MLIILPSVQRVLDRLYWQDFGRTANVSNTYLECISALEKLPTSIATIIADRPLSWARQKGTVIKVRNLWFLYKRDNKGNVVVEEVYDLKRNEILTECQFEPIKQILEFEKRMNKVEL